MNKKMIAVATELGKLGMNATINTVNSDDAIFVQLDGHRAIVAAGVINIYKGKSMKAEIEPVPFPVRTKDATVAVAKSLRTKLIKLLAALPKDELPAAKTASARGDKHAKKGAAEAAESTEPKVRKSARFRLLMASKAVWSEFGTQKGRIVAALYEASKKGATLDELRKALPDVKSDNISFYLSRWQKAEILEKLEA
jgi:hypothetical protein